MRVLTLNLWGRRGDWDARREVIAEGFRELPADLVAFIEAIGYHTTTRWWTSSVPTVASGRPNGG